MSSFVCQEILSDNVKTMENLRTYFSGAGLVVSMVTIFFVYKIGRRQNEINQNSLQLNNFCEVFLMPTLGAAGWLILITNASAYPIYLNSYTLNGIETIVGSSCIPHNPNNWYAVPIPITVQAEEQFLITVRFEDHLGKKYQTLGHGSFAPNWWTVRSEKRIAVG